MNEKNFIVSDEELKIIEFCLLQRKLELEECSKRYELVIESGDTFYTGYHQLANKDLSIIDTLLKRIMF